ncbi:uncharacterized protein [Diadema antillarum]|uniref:uncharacterized protein n=1 Tax=Diadema antillarum TaxID=105358 RepID=UPI003A8653F5
MKGILVLAVLVVVFLCLADAKGSNRQNRRRKADKGNRREKGGETRTTTQDPEYPPIKGDCSEWEWSECVPKTGVCGKGKKTGSRHGGGCMSWSTTAKCRVNCDPAQPVQEGEDAEATVEGESSPAPSRRGSRGGKAHKAGRRGGKKGAENVRDKGNGGRDGGRKTGKKGKPGKPNKKPRDCKYHPATFSDCDPTTGRQNKTRVLKSGDQDTCNQTIVSEVLCGRKTIRKENKRCNYTMGNWGECNETTNRRYRVDTLSDPTQASEDCRPSRTLEKPCPERATCEYNWVSSECDSNTNTLTLTGTLMNTEGGLQCESSKTKTVPCTKKNGKEKCKFGEWGRYTECVNGMRTRTREVRKGGKLCRLLAKEVSEC